MVMEKERVRQTDREYLTGTHANIAHDIYTSIHTHAYLCCAKFYLNNDVTFMFNIRKMFILCLVFVNRRHVNIACDSFIEHMAASVEVIKKKNTSFKDVKYTCKLFINTI